MTAPPREPLVLRMTAVRAEPWFLGAEVALAPGQCAVIAASDAAAEHFADLAQGLASPAEGVVALCGEEWQALSVPATYALRARIGRVGPSMHWIQNLNVDENVLLAQLDRSQRTERELREQAAALARQLGLDEVPRSRPHDTSASDLLASASVRAFLGAPALVLIGSLPAPAPASLRAGLCAVAADACARGTAVLWLGGAAVGDGVRDFLRGALAADTVLELGALQGGGA